MIIDKISNAPIVDYLLQEWGEKVLGFQKNKALHFILNQVHYVRLYEVIWGLEIGDLPVDRFILMVRQQFMVENVDTIHHQEDRNGALPLHVVCSRDFPIALIQLLIDKDVSTLNTPDRSGLLPIHSACSVGNAKLKVLKLLVEKGGVATLAIRNNTGNLPLHCLCTVATDNLKEVEFLIKEYPGSVSTRNQNGDFPVTLLNPMAGLDSIYTLLRGYPQVICRTAR